jgi:hypothetical protein
MEVYFICDDGESLLIIRAPTKQQCEGEDAQHSGTVLFRRQ